MPSLQIGTAAARPGEIVTGWFEAVRLPTGGKDRFPVIIAQGREADGPVMWVTTGIHGPEHTGLISVHRLITPALVGGLSGTLVAIPTLSPAGLRTRDRTPYYHQGDPNRVFPQPAYDANRDKPPENRSGLEVAYARLFEAIVGSEPACLIDLHNAWIGSIPWAFRDPVFFHKERRKERHEERREERGKSRGMSRVEAQALHERTGDLLDAFGFTIINEFVADDYVKKGLHRSVSGSALNAAGIPAFTVELGSWMHVDANVAEACAAGLRNVMRRVGMLGGEREPIEGIPVIRPGYDVRRHMTPHMPEAGIVHHLVRPGEMVGEGQPLVRITDIFGQPVGEDDGLLRSEHEGFVMGWQHGVVRYRGEAILGLAIRDDSKLVVPYPE
jgi:predicted deacylase